MPPVIDYGRSGGASVTGGYVYRGTRLPELRGAYLYGDYVTGHVWALVANGGQLASNTEIASVSAISSFGEDRDGEVYIVSHGTGSIWMLDRQAGTGPAEFPARLSDTGLFRDTARMYPADGVLEYQVASRLWSDGALKRRFVVLPRGARIGFQGNDPWDFPVGTVFVKHFEIETVVGMPSSRRRLETRVLVHEEGGWAGYTYRWNQGQTDADLLPDRTTESLTVTDANGMQRSFDWTYPSRTDCMQCHTAAAGRVLGANTRQLNHDVRIEGVNRNQLDAWNAIPAFTTDIGAASPYPSLPDPADETATLDARARAYLAANCSMCHRPSGPTPVSLDLRYDTPEAQTGLIDVMPTLGDLSLTDARLVAPGAKERSVLWERMRRTDGTRMPPLGTVVPDDEGIALIGSWIDSHP